jgi:hypothetical protein
MNPHLEILLLIGVVEEDVENPAEKRELKKRHAANAVDHVKDKINRLKI